MTQTFPKMSEDFRKSSEESGSGNRVTRFEVPVPVASPHTTSAPVFSLLNRESRDESTVIFMDFSILALIRVYTYFKRVTDKHNGLKFYVRREKLDLRRELA